MNPTEVAAGVTTADGDFAAHNFLAQLDLEPRTDRVAILAVLQKFDLQPMPEVRAGIAPDLPSRA